MSIVVSFFEVDHDGDDPREDHSPRECLPPTAEHERASERVWVSHACAGRRGREDDDGATTIERPHEHRDARTMPLPHSLTLSLAHSLTPSRALCAALSYAHRQRRSLAACFGLAGFSCVCGSGDFVCFVRASRHSGRIRRPSLPSLTHSLTPSRTLAHLVKDVRESFTFNSATGSCTPQDAHTR